MELSKNEEEVQTNIFFSSTQGGEITVYWLIETAWQISSVGLHVEKHRHDYGLKHPLGRQD